MARRVQTALAAQGEEGEEVMNWGVDGEDGWRPGPGLEDWEMEGLVALSDEEESEDEDEGEEEDEKKEEEEGGAGGAGAGGEGGAGADEQQTLAFRPSGIAI